MIVFLFIGPVDGTVGGPVDGDPVAGDGRYRLGGTV
jgi:hypothetical protein